MTGATFGGLRILRRLGRLIDYADYATEILAALQGFPLLLGRRAGLGCDWYSRGRLP